MNTYTNKEFRAMVVAQVVEGTADEQTNHRGEILIHTGVFEWNDRTLHDAPDPKFFALEDKGPTEKTTLILDEPFIIHSI